MAKKILKETLIAIADAIRERKSLDPNVKIQGIEFPSYLAMDSQLDKLAEDFPNSSFAMYTQKYEYKTDETGTRYFAEKDPSDMSEAFSDKDIYGANVMPYIGTKVSNMYATFTRLNANFLYGPVTGENVSNMSMTYMDTTITGDPVCGILTDNAESCYRNTCVNGLPVFGDNLVNAYCMYGDIGNFYADPLENKYDCLYMPESLDNIVECFSGSNNLYFNSIFIEDGSNFETGSQYYMAGLWAAKDQNLYFANSNVYTNNAGKIVGECLFYDFSSIVKTVDKYPEKYKPIITDPVIASYSMDEEDEIIEELPPDDEDWEEEEIKEDALSGWNPAIEYSLIITGKVNTQQYLDFMEHDSERYGDFMNYMNNIFNNSTDDINNFLNMYVFSETPINTIDISKITTNDLQVLPTIMSLPYYSYNDRYDANGNIIPDILGTISATLIPCIPNDREIIVNKTNSFTLEIEPIIYRHEYYDTPERMSEVNKMHFLAKTGAMVNCYDLEGGGWKIWQNNTTS